MKLSVQIEIDKTMDLETPKRSVIVGRSPDCDLIIPNKSVSREHCRIEISKGIFYITDLNSSNGTFIDGVRIAPDNKTPYLTSAQLTIGRLDCELVDTSSPTIESGKNVTTKFSDKGDHTATIRVSRLDLNKPSITLEMEKKIQFKGPRNPITADIQKPKEETKESKTAYVIMFFIILGAIAWLLVQDL